MAILVSPGTSITVTDESINIGAGPGTVPLIFIATAENKTDPTGVSIAVGTRKESAGKIFSITSQRDLLNTFGEPKFYSISGTSVNGYPLNEYGLLTAYSYLGITNLCRVVRADIDTAQLLATSVEPTSPALIGTYWFDQSALPNGSAYGLFTRTGTGLAQVWSAVTPKFVYNFATGSANAPTPTDGVIGDYAVVFQTITSTLSYWKKFAGTWVQLGDVGQEMIIQSVWPDLTIVTEDYWVKTSSIAQGANMVLRRMDATTAQFLQVESPILSSDTDADIYYASEPMKSIGQIYAQPVVTTTSTGTTLNGLQFKRHMGTPGAWTPMGGIVGSASVPTRGPDNGQLWFNGLIGIGSNGMSSVDIMYADGTGAWQNVNLPGFTALPTPAGAPTLFTQPADPRDGVSPPMLVYGDIWVKTDMDAYPVIYRWSGAAWVLVNNADQTSPNGIVFGDARPNPMFRTSGTGYTGDNNNGPIFDPITGLVIGYNPDLDFDAPNADLYPRGFLLWNTRYSANNVKQWASPHESGGMVAAPDDTNNGSTGRWVTYSGNDASGVPYTGADAQHVVVTRAINQVINDNDVIRSEDMYYNLIATPGHVESISSMLSLNDDIKNVAFVVGDTPFTLSPTGTALQSWATNRNLALGDGVDGLVSASPYFGIYYPSCGLATNVDGTSVVVPSSHMALRTIAYSDQVSYPWFAPAGLQRGVVTNASAVGYVNENGQFISVSLNEGQRNTLYQNGINPIRIMPQGGITIFGQKTRQSFASARDRINVVRLENYLRYQLELLSQPFLFQPNDRITRTSVKAAFDSALSELVTLRGIVDFLTVCDESNNTPARIDRNELWVDIAIQATRSIEFIYIPIRLVNTGSSMSIR